VAREFGFGAAATGLPLMVRFRVVAEAVRYMRVPVSAHDIPP
jgi:hypothetical protein